MQEHTEYKRLEEAYSPENLTRICGQILQLYKLKQYERLRALLVKIGDPDAHKVGDRQLLVKLMLWYHPDRLSYYRQLLKNEKEHSSLAELSHILVTQNDPLLFDHDAANAVSTTDPDLPGEEYAWQEAEEANYYDSDPDDTETDTYYGENDNSFYTIFKKSMYGRIDIILPSYMLEDMDELELANRGMDSLEGIAHCRHLVMLNLSGNALTNTEGMEALTYLEELYIPDNAIGYIDTLGHLSRLRVLDLSGNQVDDITPLFELEHLEFVNLEGNPVPALQEKALKAKGCIVII